MEDKELVILSKNKARSNYAFDYAVQTLGKFIIRYDKAKKMIEMLNCKLRFMTYEYFERYGQYGYRREIMYSELFELELDKYREIDKGENK
jgi:hypothetical protein